MGHNPENEKLNWSFYSRVGTVSTKNQSGLSTYLRLKRTTNYIFRDIVLSPMKKIHL